MASTSSQPAELVRSGSCLCGNIKYQVKGEPFNSLLCHCENCKKISGSANWCNGWFWKDVGLTPPVAAMIANQKTSEKKQFTLTHHSSASLKEYVDPTTDSGNALRRQFCSHCGSTLFVETDGFDNVIVVALGSLDKGQKPWTPAGEVYSKDSFGWTSDAAGAHVFDGPFSGEWLKGQIEG